MAITAVTAARGRRPSFTYLDIQKRARADRRPVDEYLQFYVLECFLVRLSRSRYAKRYVLKGGALLAAFGERRPTLDIDFLAQGQASDPEAVLAVVNEIAGVNIDDGVTFDLTTAKATLIRDEDIYPGVRVTMFTQLWTARQHLLAAVLPHQPVDPGGAPGLRAWLAQRITSVL